MTTVLRKDKTNLSCHLADLKREAVTSGDNVTPVILVFKTEATKITKYNTIL
jgi:hypothetical protein